MSFKIGFSADAFSEQNTSLPEVAASKTTEVRKSLVEVYFPDRNRALTYFNDRFDLHCGDIVYVDGKLEGLRGRVEEVTYNFKIKVSDYKRVIGLADTNVKGELYLAGSHFVAFDTSILPFEKVITWFKAPEQVEEDDYVVSTDDTTFALDNLNGMKVTPLIAERGKAYYEENRVVYLCVDGNKGRAIVNGSRPYDVEFTYQNGEIGQLTCNCFCTYTCKHEVAVMLQLRESLQIIEAQYATLYAESGYFAAVSRQAFNAFVFDSKESGRITLN